MEIAVHVGSREDTRFLEVTLNNFGHSVVKLDKLSKLSSPFMIISTSRVNKWTNLILGLLWTKVGIGKSLRVMNAYELIEIYLGNIEAIKSIFELTMEVLVIVYGFDMMY